jgi:hypothetical protein
MSDRVELRRNVTNVLNGTVQAKGAVVNGGTVVRLDVLTSSDQAPQLVRETVVAAGFAESLNSSALVLGPTGDALGFFDTLLVADTINNRIAAIPFASFRSSPVQNGGITVSEGGGLNAPLGILFGLTLTPDHIGILFVDDGDNTLKSFVP